MKETPPGFLDSQKLAAARLWASHEFPYLASAIFAASTHAAPDLGSMVVDRFWRIHVDPAVIDESSVEQLGGEILHLTSHLLRDHASRADATGLKNAEELHHWVDAADAEIADDYPGIARVMETVRPDDLAVAENRLAEEYFRRGAVRDGSENDCGSGAHGVLAAWEPPPPSDGSGSGLDEHEQSLVRRRVASDIEAAGDLAPAGLRAWAIDQVTPTVDWRKELAASLRRAVAVVSGAVDYSYSRPSRRSSAVKDVVMSSMRRPAVEIAVVIDTSASVTEELLGAALAELDGLLKANGARAVRFIACDDAVHAASRVVAVSDVVAVGGGGTDMTVGIEAALDARPRPQVLVVLTDGFTPWPAESPRADVIVGLLESDDPLVPPDPPSWARTISISS